jgi:GT2 family glycosyltransferase
MSAALTSIIIINYKTRDLTNKLLQSIHSYCDHGSIEIILIDNGSDDGSVEYLKKHNPEVEIIGNKTNLGFAKAANQGTRIAKGKYFWFLNSDCVLKSSILDILIESIEKVANGAIVTPRTVNNVGEFHAVCRRFPSYKNIIFSRGSLLYRIPFFHKYHETYTLPDYKQVTRVEAVAGTAMFVCAEDFLSVDGFDERFFLYFEDTDLCFRLNQIGKYCYYNPEAELVHANQGSSKTNPVKRITIHHKSTAEYFLKWFSGNYIGNILLITMLSVNLLFQLLINYASMRNNTKY